MKRAVLLTGLILALAGCANQAAPPPTAPEATLLPPPIPTPTQIPPTPTPVEISAQVTVELANCRFGPGTVYMSLNEIPEGRRLTAVGRNETATWRQVEDPLNPGGHCWVSAAVIEEDGDAARLPVVPPPFVTVTKLTLRVEPNRVVVDCDDFPQTVFFEAEITVNGPTVMTWQWEASTGAASDVGTLFFEESGTQVINEFYRVNAPNEYWVRLKILTPNEMAEQVAFPVSCNP